MQEFIAYLSARIEEGKAEIAVLLADGRGDEADLAKVRTNIYDVCRTVSLALADRPGAGAGAVAGQLENLRTQWSGALEKTRRHGDAERAVVEEIKLAALDDAAGRFREMVEV